MKKFIVILLLACGLTTLAQEANVKLTANAFMKAAVLEGLQKNNFDIDLAQKVSVNYALFVGKCKICEGVKAAFSAYAKNTSLNKDIVYFKEPLLTDKDVEVRLKALEKLVQEYVEAYYIQHSYLEEEKTIMRNALEKEANNSKMMTNAKYCASCTGSCKKPA